jgi:hypothetical protein
VQLQEQLVYLVRVVEMDGWALWGGCYVCSFRRRFLDAS